MSDGHPTPGNRRAATGSPKPPAEGRSKSVRILGVPMDLGAGRRGVDMGPSAMRIGRLHERLRELGVSVEDGGNIEVRIPEEMERGERRQIFLQEIAAVCSRLAREVKTTLEAGRTPIILGGDHSLAVGSVAGTASFCRSRGERVGLIWIDAHTDMNTPETSVTGNVHGMPLAALLGAGPEPLCRIEGFSPKVFPENAIVIGVRSVDPTEKETIRRLGVKVITMKELDTRGMHSVMEEALEIVGRETAGFHCSFDLDVVDPQVAPGVGTPVRGGITYRESHLAMEMVFDSRRCLALDCVEVNPVLDVGNSTGLLGVELIASALGKKIL